MGQQQLCTATLGGRIHFSRDKQALKISRTLLATHARMRVRQQKKTTAGERSGQKGMRYEEERKKGNPEELI